MSILWYSARLNLIYYEEFIFILAYFQFLYPICSSIFNHLLCLCAIFKQVVQAVLSSFLFGDCRDITFQWIRGKNAMLILENVGISNVATTIDSKFENFC